MKKKINTSYVRVDQYDKYIYFLNDVLNADYKGNLHHRSQYLVKANGSFPCVRMKKLWKLPVDKKVNVWYHKQGRGGETK